jgi:hypothetical protein
VTPLTDQDRAVLAIEAGHWRYQATKEQHVRDALALSPVRYYQLVAALVDDPGAAAHAPAVVSRLRAVRARGRRRAS